MMIIMSSENYYTSNMLLFRLIQLMLEGNLFVPDLSYIVGLLYLFVNSLVNCDVLRKKDLKK